MERVFGEEVRNHHTRSSTTAHLLFNQYHPGVKFLCSDMKLSLYHMRQKTPGPALSLEVVIEELSLGVASLVANLAIQIFCNWNQSPHNLLNILRTWSTYCESSKRQTKHILRVLAMLVCAHTHTHTHNSLEILQYLRGFFKRHSNSHHAKLQNKQIIELIGFPDVYFKV